MTVFHARRGAADRASVAAGASVIWMNYQIPVPPPISGICCFRAPSSNGAETPSPRKVPYGSTIPSGAATGTVSSTCRSRDKRRVARRFLTRREV